MIKLYTAIALILFSSSAAYARDNDDSGDDNDSGKNAHFTTITVLSSNPGAGAVISESPKKITIRFTEEMNYKKSSIVVYSLGGNRFNEGEVLPTAMGKTTIGTKLSRPLPPGKYVVKWKSASAVPSHGDVEGDFNFTIQ